VGPAWQRAARFLQADLWTLDAARLDPPARLGVRALRLVLAVADELGRGELQLRAAGLVYSTLLSLVPFLAVAFSVLKAFGAHQQLGPALAAAFQPLGVGGAEVARQVIAFVDNVKVGVLGAVGVAGLFYTVVTLVGKVEDALNRIWHVRHARGLGRKLTDYLSLVLVGPVLVFTALALIAAVRSHRVVLWLVAVGPLGGLLTAVAGRVLPLLFLGAAFTFLYRFLPYTRVPLGAAFAGGVTAAVLWQLAGVAFTTFVAGSPERTAIYSGFAILLLFLVWLDVAWLVVLLGAQVAHFVQHPPGHPTHAGRARLLGAARERLALDLLAEVTRRHLAGRPPPGPAELARRWAVPAPALHAVVDALAPAGVLVRAVDPDRVTLGRAPETVLLAEVLDLVREGGHPAGPAAGDDPAGRVLALRDGGARAALAGLTARDLVRPPGSAGPGHPPPAASRASIGREEARP
jgi:membrane protein